METKRRVAAAEKSVMKFSCNCHEIGHDNRHEFVWEMQKEVFGNAGGKFLKNFGKTFGKFNKDFTNLSRRPAFYPPLTSCAQSGLIPLATIFIQGPVLAGLPVKYNSSFVTRPGARSPGRIGRKFHFPESGVRNDPAPWRRMPPTFTDGKCRKNRLPFGRTRCITATACKS